MTNQVLLVQLQVIFCSSTSISLSLHLVFVQFKQIFAHISGNNQNEPEIDEAFFEYMSQIDELEAGCFDDSYNDLMSQVDESDYVITVKDKGQKRAFPAQESVETWLAQNAVGEVPVVRERKDLKTKRKRSKPETEDKENSNSHGNVSKPSKPEQEVEQSNRQNSTQSSLLRQSMEMQRNVFDLFASQQEALSRQQALYEKALNMQFNTKNKDT